MNKSQIYYNEYNLFLEKELKNTSLENTLNKSNILFTISEFLKLDEDTWIINLINHVNKIMKEYPSKSQIKAWYDCFYVLKIELNKLTYHPKTYLIFEYELHRERGRRPDVLLLSGNTVFILEFKQHSNYTLAQIDQAKGYASDLKSYHKETHNLNVKTLLILTGSKKGYEKLDDIIVSSSNLIYNLFKNKLSEPFNNIQEWYDSQYLKSPSIIQSARLFYEKEELPQINKASSAGIQETISTIKNIVHNENNNYNLIVVTGVPGAGKTLVGLNYVHNEKIKNATFLSGNGPLVQVLQSTLNSNTFVQGVHGYLKTHSNLNKIPPEDVIVFDEAQRAWDSDQVKAKLRGDFSEPTELIKIAENKKSFTIIALVGEGQEIYLGEESGMELWNDAISNFSSKNWNIYGSDKLSYIFKNNYNIQENLNLTVSLRTHCALTLQEFINNIISNNIKQAKKNFTQLKTEQYPIYITQELNWAKSYVKERYDNDETKTYGLIASSKGSSLIGFGVNNSYNSQPNANVYFTQKNNKRYCNKLEDCVTEFSCQGLELDFPIVCWDNDFLYEDNQWKDKIPNHKAKNSLQLRKNTYRVLLTRGRDGMIIYIPPKIELKSIFDLFLDVGLPVLK